MTTDFLVTGGCGFIGAPLTTKLVRAGHSVAVIDNLCLGSAESLGDAAHGVQMLQMDVRDSDAVHRAFARLRPARVIHLAAMHFIPTCDDAPKRCIDVNVGGTQSVFDACAAVPVESVVIASSAAVYAPSATAHHEDSSVRPTDIYGLTKLWTEQLGERASGLLDVSVRVARLFNVFGPGETNPHLIPSIIAQARQSSQLHLGNLDTARDYVFVDDVAEALAAMSVATLPLYSIMNIGRGVEASGREIVSVIGQLLARALDVISDPARVRHSDRPHLCSDPGRAQALLGWRAETGLAEGLKAALVAPMAAGAGSSPAVSSNLGG